MARHSQILLAFLTVLSFGTPTRAQSPGDTNRTVTFDEAVELALQADVVARDGQLQERGLDADADAARAARRPTLALGLVPSQGFGLGIDPTTGQAVTQGRTSFGLQGSGGILLYDGGRTRARIEAIAGSRSALVMNVQEARRRAVFAVAALYTQVLLGQGLVALAVADSAAQAEQLAQVRTFVRVGVRPPADTLAQRTYAAGARRSLAAARQNLSADRVALARALGLPVMTAIVAVTPPTNPDLGDVTRIRRPAVAAAEARVEAARLDVVAVRRDRAPTVSVGAYTGTDFSSLQTRPDAAGGVGMVPLFNQLSSNRSASAAVTFSVPILDGRTTRARENRAQVEVSRAELAVEAARLDADAEAAQAEAQLEGAAEQLAAAVEQAGLAEAYTDVQLRRYQLAAGSLFEWSDARTRYVAAAAAAEEARHLLWLARVQVALVDAAE